MTAADDSLDALMARLADGDREVFREVFARLWPAVSRCCRAALGGSSDADDAAQRAMVKIFDRAASYDRARPALPWALAIATWECRTMARSRGRRREVAMDTEMLAELSEPSGEARLERALVSAALRALGTLSDPDRQALIDTFWEQASSARGPTARKRKARALARLRAAFRRIYGID